MIDLFSVKLNGEYDDIGAVPSIQNGLFLCDTDGESYTRGYSYQITDGNAERIDSVKDYKIKQAIYPTIESVCEWLNNYFLVVSSISPYRPKMAIPQNGDLVFASDGQKGFVSYVTVENDVISFDNSLFNADDKYVYFIISFPQDVEAAISKMIYYDVYNRETADGLKSENIGNYSYSKEETTVGSLAYPAELVSGLEVNYKKIRFVQ